MRHADWPAMLVLFYAAAIFTGAGLGFLLEPMTAKMLLPLFGGSPTVWTTSLLFFQAALLLGYSWAYVSIRVLGLRRQPWAQLALLAVPLALLPVTLPAWAVPPSGSEPAIWLLLVLAATVGVPYVAVTTASPVLQRWFSVTDGPSAGDPYYLYALSNAGSLIGLLAYPFVIEPNLRLADQARLWTAGYVLLFLLTAGSAVLLVRHRNLGTEGSEPSEPEAPLDQRPVTVRRRLYWLLLAAIPSSLLLGVTSHLTTDVAAVPLLWVLPLAIYLATFIVAFSPRNPLTPRRAGWILAPLAVAVAVTMVGAVALPLGPLIVVNLAAFAAAALLAHGRLAADRPAPAHLTQYYLLVATGGALGGLFNALVAPHVFSSILEYPIAIIAILILRPGPTSILPPSAVRGWIARHDWWLDLALPAGVFVGSLVVLAALSRLLPEHPQEALSLFLAALAVGVLVFVRRPVRFGLALGVVLLIPLLVGQHVMFTQRTFFGLTRVTTDGQYRLLTHGTTVHGAESTDPARADEPLSYYNRSGPLGLAFGVLQRRDAPLRIGVVGLGAGSVASYGRTGDNVTFFEIDPVVVRVASDPSLFHFLSDSAATVSIVVGDGRLSLEAQPDGEFDVLVLDAFSGDAPPAHLLTTEAFTMYARKLRPDGVLLVHTSNRYVNVEGVVAAVVDALHLPAIVPLDPAPSTPGPPQKEPSSWVIVTRNETALAPFRASLVARAPVRQPGLHAWSDDFSDIVSVICWGG